jgi:hypothetical protein
MSSLICDLTDTLIPEKSGSSTLVQGVAISLEMDGDHDEVFGNIGVLLPLPQNGKIIRSQAHKALAGEFRKRLDMYYSDEEFWINGYTAVSNLEVDETTMDESS